MQISSFSFPLFFFKYDLILRMERLILRRCANNFYACQKLCANVGLIDISELREKRII